MATVTLTCQTCRKEWERPSQRGRRPLNCPACAADAAAERERRASEPVSRAWEAQAEAAMERLGTFGRETDRAVEYTIARVIDTGGADYYCGVLADLTRPRRHVTSLTPDWSASGR